MSEQRIITFLNGERYMAEITHCPAKGNMPERYEVEIEAGVSIGDLDTYGDNPLYAWISPCNSIEQAVCKFAEWVEQKRKENGYYDE